MQDILASSHASHPRTISVEPKKTRKYTVFVCLEYNGDIVKLSKEIANKVSQKISDEQRMKIDFELENFEKEIEKELGNNTTEEDDE